jgi:acyl-CoA synthetase (AMP-forming)/AMP-acid ligase II
MLLQMAADGMGDRMAIGSRDAGVTVAELAERALRAGTVLARLPGERVAVVDLNSAAVPLALFGAALADKPFVPINYRLADDQLRALVARTAPATIIAGEGVAARLEGIDGVDIITRAEFLESTVDVDVPLADPYAGDPDAIAVLLYTSGTTGEPKAAVLRHRNLASYVLSSVEFAGAGEDEAAIVSVPPYHIAGISSVLSSTYSGRRVVYVEVFDPSEWVDVVRAEQVTHAMVVPTMLNRILDVIAADGEGLPSLRALSYGGGPMPAAVIERALALLPDVGFVNAYGLTETSSTIALLDPDDHREAFASDVAEVRARLESVGRPLPAVEVSIRGAGGEPLGSGERGEFWV